MAKMDATGKSRKLSLVNYRSSRNEYDPADFSVAIDRSLFEETGDGVTARQYYYIDENGVVTLKPKTLVGTLFHEFCHALHDVERIGEMTERNQLYGTNTILAWTWGEDEELRTITGYTLGVNYDPVCDHCFDLCHCLLHRRNFYPRYSHDGYDASSAVHEEEGKRRKLLAHFSESRKIMEGWKDYVL
jgi:hypothetical protein